MTRVDFYHHVPEQLAFTCRLVRKIYASSQPVVIWCATAQRLRQIDEALWTFQSESFLPHLHADHRDAARTPILLSDRADWEPSGHGVLINLDQEPPPFFARFERLLEVVGPNDDEREAARRKWQFYRQRGYPVQGHDVSQHAG